MPDSQAQVRYAGAIRSGKVKASPKTRAWADEVLDKMSGRSMDELPEHTAKPKGIRNYGKR